MTLIKEIFILFDKKERKALYWMTFGMVVMSLLDMVGIAAIFPFLKVVSNPDSIQANEKLRWLYNNLGFTSKDVFLVMLGVAAFVILTISNIYRVFIMTIFTRFTWIKHHDISKRLLSNYLYEPYAFFLNRNSAELVNYLMCEVPRVLGQVIIPLMQLISKVVLVVLILGLLVFVDPVIAMFVFVIIGGGYALIYVFFRRKLFQIGKDTMQLNGMMYKALNESFGGIKEIKLIGTENIFINQFARPVKKIAKIESLRFLIDNMPRYVFESVSFGGLLFITIFIAVIKHQYDQVIPIVGLYALAAFRLMPALQQIFQCVSQIRFGHPALSKLYKDFSGGTLFDYEKNKTDQILPFFKSIDFQGIEFQYALAEKPAMKNFSLTIEANTTIGIVGGTGAGKTTLIDILLGLLRPQHGQISVDGIKICDENLRMWQKNIGYVPQNIYLTDDTITHNIAFGVPDEKIDRQAVEKAARLAHIHNFITNKLPKGYETEVGERGVRFSGGEKQRIGIARALYNNPSLLVFDEATSALDGITEKAILEAVYDFAHKKTIVIIAHRLSSVKRCDMIYLLEDGRVADKGSYRDLLMKNEQFQRMAKDMKDESAYSSIS